MQLFVIVHKKKVIEGHFQLPAEWQKPEVAGRK